MKAKKTFAKILKKSGLTYALAKASPNQDITVLMFHNINKKYFEEQVIYIKKNFKPISERDFLNYYRGKNLPSNSVLITFDDGYKDIYKTAYPILKKYKVPAIVFLVAGMIGKKELSWYDKIVAATKNNKESDTLLKKAVQMNEKERKKFMNNLKSDKIKKNEQNTYMTWEEINKIKDFISIGAHTYNHPPLQTLSKQEIEKEIHLSNELIQEKTGIKPKSFCYPFGIYNEKAVSTARKFYELSFTSDLGRNNKSTNPHRLKRIGINYHDTTEILAAKMLKLSDSIKNRKNIFRNIKTKNTSEKEVSIIIKALNEEQNIERAIKSSLIALQNLNGEVILADSLSTDKTISIAKKFPVRIIQLKNTKDRSCGVGPQLGYQHSKGKYVYILDGDMALDPRFLKVAKTELEKSEELAGVAGQVEEMNAQNIVFERRKKAKKQTGYKKKLEMGGLYKKEALEDVGYFSNKNLHAYEEAELGFRLIRKGWKLKRLGIPGIKHHGYSTNSFGVFKKRWKTGYIKGAGELLRSSVGKSFFIDAILELKIYLFLILWWLILLTLAIFYPSGLVYWLIITLILLLIFLVKKRNLKEWSFSIASWHYSTLGVIWGFFSKPKNPTNRISSKIIK